VRIDHNGETISRKRCSRVSASAGSGPRRRAGSHTVRTHSDFFGRTGRVWIALVNAADDHQCLGNASAIDSLRLLVPDPRGLSYGSCPSARRVNDPTAARSGAWSAPSACRCARLRCHRVRSACCGRQPLSRVGAVADCRLAHLVVRHGNQQRQPASHGHLAVATLVVNAMRRKPCWKKVGSGIPSLPEPFSTR